MRTEVVVFLSSSYEYLCLAPCFCVYLFVCGCHIYSCVCTSLCMNVCEFVCRVKHIFHSSGVTSFTWFCLQMALNVWDLPNYILLLTCVLCSVLYVSLTKCAFFLSAVCTSLCLCLWVSLLLLSVFDTLCPILSILLHISFSVPPWSSHFVRGFKRVSLQLLLMACVFVFTYIPMCLSLSLSFCASGYGLCVCVSCLLAPIYGSNH